MLEYQFKVNTKTDQLNEIKCDYVYFSLDKSYIYGVTDAKYGLRDNQIIYIKNELSNEYMPYNASIKNKVHRGYVEYMIQSYNIQTFIHFDGVKKIEYKGIVYADGKKYLSNDGINLTVDSPFVIGDNSFKLNDTSIIIPTRYYIVDSNVCIENVKYYIDYNQTLPYITLNNGVKLYAQDYNDTNNLPKTIIKTHFKIQKKEDDVLDVKHVSPTKIYKTVQINNTEFTLDKIYGSVVINDKLIVIDNPIYSLTAVNNVDNKVFGGDDNFPVNDIHKSFDYNPDANLQFIFYNAEPIKINDVWRNVESGDALNIYLEANSIQCKVGDIINVKSTIPITKMYYVNSNKVIVNNKEYEVSDNTIDYMVYWDNELEYSTPHEYEIHYTNESKTTGYILIDNTPITININGNTAIKPYNNLRQQTACSNINHFEVKKYYYVLINGKRYFVYNETIKTTFDEVITKNVIYYDDNTPVNLIVEYSSLNQIRCKITSTLDINNNDFITKISNNKNEFIFYLVNSLFNDSVISNIPVVNKDYIVTKYNFYYSTDNLNLHLSLSNDCALNLHKEYICDNLFFNTIYDHSISPIIDMEKDIYYPAYFDYDTQESHLINQIIFDLHFRSRDLQNWSIIQDNSMSSDAINRCNWNILDAYAYKKDTLNPTDVLKPSIDFNDFQYYQPSDLLYFLNFSDNDVFYQKNKLSHSFIRMLFFDSPDPYNQSLLCTSTVFINEGDLYMKYINNLNSDLSYINVNEIDSSLNRVISNDIGVNKDTYDYYSNKVTALKNNRLSASFTINNMFEALESSEGFYLYMFKNYSNGLHQRTIYMKVEFNHAGVGKTVNFMQPFKIVNGHREMLNFSDSNDIQLLKKGIKLSEFIDYLYIPINVKYDFKMKKYIYYLPTWLTIHNDKSKECMRFNLYETKIQDESNIINQKPN